MSRVVEQGRGVSWSGLGRAGRFLWEAVWLPFWLGSTMPPPRIPGRPDRAAAVGERTPQILQQLDELRSVIWRQRFGILLFRSIWLALAALNIYLALRVIVDRNPAFIPFLLLALALLALGAFLIATAQPSRGQLARTLDRSFSLRERVSTAYETAQADRRIGGVRALQVLEATRIAGQVGKASAFQPRRPVREIALTVAMVIVGAALLIALLLQGGLGGPGSGASDTPGQAAGRPAGANGDDPQGNQGPQPGNQPGNTQGGQGQQPGNGPTAQGEQDLAAVASALQGNTPTQQAGNQIANGDYAGAAQTLRDVGSQASQIPQEQRQELAEDLREAAGQVSDPQLAQDLNEAANALEDPAAAGAQQALNDLAEDIERLGEGQGQGQGQGDQGGDQGQQPQGAQPGGQSPGGGNNSGQGGSAPQLPSQQRAQPSSGPATDPLGANGQPVQLPKGDPRNSTINTQNQGNNRGNGPTDPGSAAASGGQLRQGDVGEAGVDPNQVPYEQRGTVQQYFTPQPADGDER